MQELNQIVDQTIQALEEMKRNGVTHVEVAKATVEELGKKPVRAVVGPLTSAGEGRIATTPREVCGEPRLVGLGSRPTMAAKGDWAELEAMAKACRKCGELARTRKNVVFGVGNRKAELMFIGEAPGADEDEQGEPFVGRAGQLLTKIIEAMGFKREEVYIANILKCRPPNNRPPLPDESANCLPYLLRQIELVKPKVMVALGATAVRSLLGDETGITKMRGNWYEFHGVPIMPTFHPAYLLRNPPAKKYVWADMKTVIAKLGRELPPQST